MSELARCHGCNSERVDVLFLGQPAGQPLWLASCRICGLSIRRHSREEVVEAWNRRPTPEIGRLIERLAEYAHNAWCGWMRYQFQRGVGLYQKNKESGAVEQVGWQMNKPSFERWQRQMNTAYADLPEEEKQSDCDEAHKILSLVAPYLRSKIHTSDLLTLPEQLANHLHNLVKYDKQYDVRYGLVISAFYKAWALGYKVGIRFDANEPEWPVIFIELPTGQISYHMPPHHCVWDGHTSEEKLARIREFLGENDALDERRRGDVDPVGQDT